MRFYDTNEAIEHINDEIDEIPLFEFWAKWLFCPHFPLHSLTSKFVDPNTSIDNILYLTTALGCVLDVLIMLGVFFGVQKISTFAQGAFASALGIFVCAAINHYVLWYVTPDWFLDFGLYLYVYILLPLLIVGNFFLIVGSVVVAAKNE